MGNFSSILSLAIRGSIKMIWRDFFVAISLLLVFEGIMPFARPERWRNYMQVITKQSDKSLRTMGLVSMLLGVALLYSVK
jgi:uncharacterized protein YjeT (DUF2065 family)